tara:strand:- start:1072 stop:1572 length:501 start_codon:yes stop_codon:yes gene_type:complete
VARGIFTASTVLTAAELNDAFSPPRCRLTNSANISLTNNLATAVTFDTETHDTGGMHSTSSNTSRITIPTGGSGMYLIGAGIEFAANATGTRDVNLRINGTTIIASSRATATSATSATRLMTNTIYPLNAGDYVEIMAFQNSGGALNITAASEYTPIFYACWLTVL